MLPLTVDAVTKSSAEASTISMSPETLLSASDASRGSHDEVAGDDVGAQAAADVGRAHVARHHLQRHVCASSGTPMVKSTEPGKLRGRGKTVRTSTRFACSATWISIICSSARAAFGFGRCTRLTASMVTSRPLLPVMTMFPEMLVRSKVPFWSRCAVFENRSVTLVLRRRGKRDGDERDGRRRIRGEH